MKRSDDVFFFTLIDFLIQVFFFGLLLFVVDQSVSFNKNIEREQEKVRLDSVMKSAGVSSITELQDILTKLAPLKSLQGTADFINRSGGLEEVKDKVKKFDDAYGLPPCFKDEVNGKMVPRTLAVFRVEDTAIEIIRSSSELDMLLVKAGVGPLISPRMSLDEFKSRFVPLKKSSPNCAYFVEVKVATQFLNPMRTVWSSFRVK